MAKLKFVIIGIGLTGISVLIHAQDIRQVRKLFFLAGKDKNYLQAYIYATCKTNGDPVLLAYKAVAIAMKSNEIWNPYEKYHYFILGRDSLEKAIGGMPESFEAHFIRFEFQNKLPYFLSYNNKEVDEKVMNDRLVNFIHQNSDKEFVLEVLNCLDKDKGIHLINLKSIISEIIHSSN